MTNIMIIIAVVLMLFVVRFVTFAAITRTKKEGKKQEGNP